MIITLTGENTFTLKYELDKLLADFLSAYGDMALERLDGEETSFERIQEALQSLPFLANRKMVLLRTPSANKQFTEHADRLLSDLPDTTDIILVEPKLDKRLVYYKLLKKRTDFREFVPLDRIGLARWLTQTAKEQGGALSVGDASYIVDRVGVNQQLLAGELDKLLLYDPNITRVKIDVLTDAAPQSTIFELLEAAFAGNAQRMLLLYEEQRSLKVEPQQIIAMLTWQLHVLAIIKTGETRPPEQIAREAKLNPFVVRKSLNVARKLSLATLKKLIADLVEIDLRLKRESLDADDALQHYLLKITQT